MEKEMDFSYITKELKSCVGGGNISSLYLTIEPLSKNQRVQAVVTLEMLKRFPIKDIKKANALYEAIQKFNYDLEKIVSGGK